MRIGNLKKNYFLAHYTYRAKRYQNIPGAIKREMGARYFQTALKKENMEVNIPGQQSKTLGEAAQAAIVHDTFKLAKHMTEEKAGPASTNTQDNSIRLTHIPIKLNKKKTWAIIDTDKAIKENKTLPSTLRISLPKNKQLCHIWATTSSKYHWLPMNTGINSQPFG